jgi:hypothetical protein
MNPDLQPPDSEFERRTRELLEQSVEYLPGALRSRLTQARYAALAQQPTRLPQLARRWAPAGAAVAAAAALLVVMLPHGVAPPTAAVLANSPIEDIEMLTDRDAVPLNSASDEDYDFYEWAVDEAGTKGSVGT